MFSCQWLGMLLLWAMLRCCMQELGLGLLVAAAWCTLGVLVALMAVLLRVARWLGAAAEA